jgi:hypothetical protein
MIYCERFTDYVEQDKECIKCDCYDKETDSCKAEEKKDA